MMTTMAGAMTQAAWNNDTILAAMGPMAKAVLGTGRMRLHGLTPNGPAFKAAPLQVWRVVGGHARLDGEDLGEIAPLAKQEMLADFWLPQVGVFFVGRASFTPALAGTTASA